jgi:CRISPR-associated protein Csm1
LEEADPLLPRTPEPERRITALLKRASFAPFLLVEGDMGGVQRYLYDLTGKGALRGLRARSFSLELLQEELVDRILGELGYSRAQMLYVGGGHFLMLLPRTREVLAGLENLRVRIGRELWAEDPRLCFHLAWVPLTVEQMRQKDKGVDGALSEAFGELHRELGRRKARPQGEILPEILGVRPHPGGVVCKVCGSWTDRLYDLKDEPNVACASCRDLHELGGELSEARYLWREGGEIRTATLLRDVPSAASRVWVLREARETLASEDARFLPLPWGEYAYDDRIDRLLEEGCPGARHLGALRMDVDNLGTLFARGIRPATLSRFATLSRLLTYFFRSLVPLAARRPSELAREYPRRVPGIWQDERRRLVLVYAGGDDLFALGAWNEAAEFAADLVEIFRAFVGGNPEVTLSGGMVVSGDKTPVAALALSAGNAEEAAKKHRLERDGRVYDKNALAFFHQNTAPSFSEKLSRETPSSGVFHARLELPRVFGWLSALTAGTEATPGHPLKPAYDRAFLRRLLAYEHLSRSRERGPLWRALAAYGASREKGKEEAAHLNKLLREGGNDLPQMRVAVQWADWLMRPGQDGPDR